MNFSLIHAGLANACLIFSLLISGMSFWNAYQKRGVDANLWGMLVIGELLYIAQVAVGVVLMLIGFQPARGWVHLLYGVVIVIVLPGIYAFTRGRNTSREAVFYGFTAMFLAGVAVRAMFTATPE